MGIPVRLARSLRGAPDEAEAVEHDGRPWTWGRPRRRRAADRAGVDATGRIGLVPENRPEHVAVAAALLATGRRAVPLDPLHQPGRGSGPRTRPERGYAIGGLELG
ncbi:hypothetical protein ACFVTP_12890 [Streptomyces celluloflavus]|uniref:hypothetical protein n=1 Tax=Streptomyces celluloflavus TaxID=58344 RepID=UPI0036DA4C9D